MQRGYTFLQNILWILLSTHRRLVCSIDPNNDIWSVQCYGNRTIGAERLYQRFAQLHDGRRERGGYYSSRRGHEKYQVYQITVGQNDLPGTEKSETFQLSSRRLLRCYAASIMSGRGYWYHNITLGQLVPHAHRLNPKWAHNETSLLAHPLLDLLIRNPWIPVGLKIQFKIFCRWDIGANRALISTRNSLLIRRLERSPDLEARSKPRKAYAGQRSIPENSRGREIKAFGKVHGRYKLGQQKN